MNDNKSIRITKKEYLKYYDTFPRNTIIQPGDRMFDTYVFEKYGTTYGWVIKAADHGKMLSEICNDPDVIIIRAKKLKKIIG